MIATLVLCTLLVKPSGVAVVVNQQSDTASIVDLATYKAVHVPVGNGPHESAVSPNGKWALIPHAVSGELVVCDVEKMEVIRRIKVKVPVADPSPAGVWPYADSNFALVTIRNDNSVVIVDLHNGETLGRIEVQKSPDGVSMKPGRG